MNSKWNTEPTKAISVLNHPKLQQARDIKTLSKGLDNLQKFFVCGSLRNNVLILYFSHPIGVSEFNLRKEQILSRMRKIYAEKGLVKRLYFKAVIAKLSQSHSKNGKIIKERTYTELAHGNFDTSHIKNPDIKKQFERIRATIKKNREA